MKRRRAAETNAKIKPGHGQNAMTREPTEMELKVARVMYDQFDRATVASRIAAVPTAFEDIPVESQQSWVDQAVVAIRTMREPTEAMIADGWLSTDPDRWDGPASCWGMMIDAASPPKDAP